MSPGALRAFYTRHPAGALRTALVRRGALVAVRAALYRSPADERPAATALAAWERRLSPPYVRTDATLRPAAARAIAQGLDSLGVADAPDAAARRDAAPRSAPLPAALRDRLADLDTLIGVGLEVGLRPARAARWRTSLRSLADASPGTLATLDRMERRLRGWIARDEPF